MDRERELRMRSKKKDGDEENFYPGTTDRPSTGQGGRPPGALEKGDRGALQRHLPNSQDRERSLGNYGGAGEAPRKQ
jgi:hypothetical protein